MSAERVGFFQRSPNNYSMKRALASASFLVGAYATVFGLHTGLAAGEIAVVTGPLFTLAATLLVGGNLTEREGK